MDEISHTKGATKEFGMLSREQEWPRINKITDCSIMLFMYIHPREWWFMELFETDLFQKHDQLAQGEATLTILSWKWSFCKGLVGLGDRDCVSVFDDLARQMGPVWRNSLRRKSHTQLIHFDSLDAKALLNRRGWKLKPSKPFCWWVPRF